MKKRFIELNSDGMVVAVVFASGEVNYAKKGKDGFEHKGKRKPRTGDEVYDKKTKKFHEIEKDVDGNLVKVGGKLKRKIKAAKVVK